MPDSPTVVDLFAGAGGLSLGLEAAGFRRLLAVERSAMAAETYFHNMVSRTDEDWHALIEAPLRTQIHDGLVVAPTDLVLEEIDLVKSVIGMRPDLLAGGPPCQGFSLAGRRSASDERNRLPWQFLRFVSELKPRMVLIENVPGIGYKFAPDAPSAPLYQLAVALKQLEYEPLVLDLDASDYGVPQRRPRTMLLGVATSVASALERGSWLPDASLPRWNSSSDGVPPRMAPTPTATGAKVTVGMALEDLTDEGYADDARQIYARNEFARSARYGLSFPNLPGHSEPIPANHELRRHSPRVTRRFALHAALAGAGLTRHRLFEIAGVERDDQRAEERVMTELAHHGLQDPLNGRLGGILKDAGREATARALAAEVVSLRSRKHSQRPLLSGEPSPTVLSLPDDFIHPGAPRTLTVREMARLQSFPDDFVFRSKVTTGGRVRSVEVPQYTQVGNAVPPLLARAVGMSLRQLT